MKVIVFGATGSVGRLAVDSLLAEGHEVTAFARRIERLAIQHPGLTRYAGDAMSIESVSQAVVGHDSVVVALCAGASRSSRVRSEGTKNIIRAMQQHGVRRLICQTTLGAGDSWANLNFFWMRIMFGLLLRPVYFDHERQEQCVRESGLDWTIVRPSALTDELQDGAYKVDFPFSERNLNLRIARADVAGALARCLSDAAFMHRAVGISH